MVFPRLQMAQAGKLPDAGEAGSREPSRINWKIDLPIGIILAAVTLTIWLPLIRWGLFIGDEGYLSYGVQRVIEGQVPYRDFQRNHAPGVYYMLVPVFKTFGASLIVTRVFCLGLLAVASAAMYFVARSAAPRWAACLAALQCVLIPPAMHKTYVPLTVVAGLALCAGLSRGTWGRCKTVLAGMAIGAIALLRQDVAVYTFLIASMSVALVRIVRREKAAPSLQGRAVETAILCAALAAGVAIVWVPVLTFFAANGALADMIQQLLLGGLRDHVEMTLPFPPISNIYAPGVPLGGRLDFSLYYFPAAMIAVGAIIVVSAVVRKRAEHKYFLIAQWTVMALLMHSLVMLRTDPAHVKQVMAAPSLIFACCAGAAAAGLRSVRRSLLGMLKKAPAFLLSAFIVFWGTGLMARAVQSNIVITHGRIKKALPLDEPRARLLLYRPLEQDLEELFRTIRQMTGPDDPIFVAPYNSVVYFVTQRRNPTRYDVLFPGLASSADNQRDVIREIDQGNVRIIIVEDKTWDGLKERRFLNYAPVIRRYLSDGFVREKNIGEYIVFVRKAPGAGGALTQAGEAQNPRQDPQEPVLQTPQ